MVTAMNDSIINIVASIEKQSKCLLTDKYVKTPSYVCNVSLSFGK